MNLTKLTADLNIIGGLPDQPTESATQLKEKFDDAGNIIKEYLNDTLTEEVQTKTASDITAGVNGAKSYTDTKVAALANGQVATNTGNISSLGTTVSGHTTTIASQASSISSLQTQVSGLTGGLLKVTRRTQTVSFFGDHCYTFNETAPSGYVYVGLISEYQNNLETQYAKTVNIRELAHTNTTVKVGAFYHGNDEGQTIIGYTVLWAKSGILG